MSDLIKPDYPFGKTLGHKLPEIVQAVDPIQTKFDAHDIYSHLGHFAQQNLHKNSEELRSVGQHNGTTPLLGCRNAAFMGAFCVRQMLQEGTGADLLLSVQHVGT
jgi:hypothetical protein